MTGGERIQPQDARAVSEGVDMNSPAMTDVGHRYTLHIDPQSVVGLKVECNYDPADEKRPCWPHDEDGTRLEGKDAADCIYVDWVTNVDASDIMWGEMELEVDVEPKWRDDYMEFHLLGLSARVAVVRPTRDQIARVIADTAFVIDNLYEAADAILREFDIRERVAVSDSQETPTEGREK